MSVAPSPVYPLGGTQIEQRRLVTQAEDYEPQARWLLDRIGIQPGWRVLDIGCGPLGVLHLLSESVGLTGTVIGLERERRFAEMARAEVAKRGLANVTVVEGDALATGLEKESFDLVHERLVMINISARAALLSEMISLLRPGGIVVLEDVDNVSWLCHPAHPSWDILLDAFHTVFHAGGGDGYIGRRLPELLRTAGAQNVQVNVHAEMAKPNEYRRTHLISLLDSVRHKIIAAGLLEDQQLQDHREALIGHLNDPATIVIDKLLVQSWGQKQG
jgi:ubiquinone/menaquinone biosynthesis C-methylase UbiE